MRKFLVFLMLVVPSLALAQSGTRYDNIVIDQHGEAVSFAKIRVCSAGSINVPCTPTVTLFNDVNLTIPLANPATADILGNFHFYATCGNRYTVQVSGTNITTYTMPDQLLACQTGGGGGGGCTIGAMTECWSVSGNAPTVATPTFGNTNAKDVKFITNNTERFRIGSAGQFTIASSGTAGRFKWPNAFVKQDTSTTRQTIGIGDGVSDTFTFVLRQVPIQTSSVTVLVDNVAKGTDNGAGSITGAGVTSGTINYSTGAITVVFTVVPADGEYVDVSDTISGNLFLGTDNTRSLSIVPNDLSVSGAVGAPFGILGYLELTTETSGGSPAAADYGTVAVYPKSDSIDELGSKQMYQADSAGNERVFCYQDGGCGATNTLGLLDPSVVGGVIGGMLQRATDASSMPPFITGTSPVTAFWPSPDNLLVSGMAACINGNMSAGSIMEFQLQSRDADSSQVVTKTVGQNMSHLAPGSVAGCYKSTSATEQYSKSQTILVGMDAGGPALGTTVTGWASEIRGAVVQPLGSTDAGTITAATTLYYPLGGSDPADTDEIEFETAMPVPGEFKNFCIKTSTSQPGTGDLVVTFRINEADSFITVTVPATNTAGWYCDYTNTETVVAGDVIDVSAANGAGTASANINGTTIGFYPDAPYDGIVVFGNYAGTSISASNNRYQSPYGQEAYSATEIDRRAPMPRSTVANNIYCVVSDVPGSNPTVLTLMVGGVATDLALSIPNGGATGVYSAEGSALIPGLSGFDLRYTAGAGTILMARSCTTGLSSIPGRTVQPTGTPQFAFGLYGAPDATTDPTYYLGPTNGDSVTINAVVYTWKTTVVGAFDVKIGDSFTHSLVNLRAAINGYSGAGVLYGTGTTPNTDVSAGTIGQVGVNKPMLYVQALVPGTTGNSLAVSASGTHTIWFNSATTLTGGLN